MDANGVATITRRGLSHRAAHRILPVHNSASGKSMPQIAPRLADADQQYDHNASPAWIKPGASFTEEGAPNRITRVDADRVHGVSADDTWCWSWPGFVEAVRTGRIQHAPGAARRSQLGRQQLHHSEAAIQFVEDVSRHPLIQHHGDNLPRGILRALQALRVGAPAEPPLLMALFHVAHAGAAAEGLGLSTAWPERKGGRRSRLCNAAQNTQRLLARFQAWIEGRDEFSSGDFQHVEFLAERGLKALGGLPPDVQPQHGRPASRAASVRGIHSCLACRWRAHQRGTYRLSDAIRDAAERGILQRKRVSAGWAGKDPDKVRLDDRDEDLKASLFVTLEVSYHSRPPMTPDERAAYRSQAAKLLCVIRSDTKRTVS